MDPLDSALKRLVKSSPLGALARRVAKANRLRVRRRLDPYDRLVVDVMAKVLKKDSNCVDAGAHVGKILRHMIRLAPQGKHFAFEPLPRLADALRGAFPSATVMQLALSDVTEKALFRHVLSDEAYSGFARRPWDSYEEHVELIEVQVRRLDDVVPPDLSIQFVKLDVEGSEYRLLRGAYRVLTAHKPFVALELGSDQEDVFHFLQEVGLGMFRLDGWLQGDPPLALDGFLSEVDYGVFTFLAAPFPRSLGAA